MNLGIRGKENIIDPSLEKSDPTPCIFTLFRKFNKTFFWDSLDMVAVSWSGRQMTSCAGICTFKPRSGECNIRLSAPLLSLRPRKDLVETLLHEMIHAYLFVTHNNRDREDHGPEFHKHMYRINDAAGTNISVYHTFNEEVKHFQGHVWRCDGPCNKKTPFYGIVRRSTNRAPGPNDRWWERHRAGCSGIFQKIEEPAGYKSKRPKKENKVAATSDMRNYFPKVDPISYSTKLPINDNKNNVNDAFRNNTLATTNSNVHGFKIESSVFKLPASNAKSTNIPTKSGSNIHTFSSGTVHSSPSLYFKNSGSGQILGGSKLNGKTSSTVVIQKPNGGPRKSKVPVLPANPSTISANSPSNQHVRNVWAKKFSDANYLSASASTSAEIRSHSVIHNVADNTTCQKRKTDVTDVNILSMCPSCEKFLTDTELPDHFCTNSKAGDNPSNTNYHRPCPFCNKPILNGSLESHLSICLEDSINSDFFDVTEDETNKKEANDVSSTLVVCPICCGNVAEDVVNSHIDECLTLQALKNGTF